MVARRTSLPALDRHLQHLRKAAAELPGDAAQAMSAAAQEDARRGRDPYGEPWAKTEDGRRFDVERHVTTSYQPEVRGTEALLVSYHRASRVLQVAWRGRPARILRPQEGQGLGLWLERITRAVARSLKPGGVRG